MHYDFKKKFNKIDSQVNRNLLVPEIDWVLNEADLLFRKIVAEPRFKTKLGFETSQRNIDSIRTVVVPDAGVTLSNNNIVLPNNYLFFLKAEVKLDKEGCSLTDPVRIAIQQTDDEHEENSFYNSSYSWREVNGTFNTNGIKLHTDGSFTFSAAKLTYIRKSPYMHNAQDFGAGTYNHPSGSALTGFVNCELPESTHGEIVDIAVMIAAGEIQTSDFQIKMNKLNFNQLT